MQAQEYGPAKWGLALRSATGATDAVIERAIEQGRILRTHILRPTWHFVAREDIRWILELTAPHVQRRMATYDRQLGLDSGMMTRAIGIIERALGDRGHLTRRELGTELARAGLASGYQSAGRTSRCMPSWRESSAADPVGASNPPMRCSPIAPRPRPGWLATRRWRS